MINLKNQIVITGCIFKGAGSKFLEGITGSANKAAYMFTDIERSAKYFKIPLRYVPARNWDEQIFMDTKARCLRMDSLI